MKFKTLLSKLIIFAITSFLIIEASIILSGASSKVPNEPYYLLILGAKINSASLNERLDTALNHLQEHPNVKVIVSGGQDSIKSISEAKYMSDYLINKGINQDQIIVEDKSSSTFDNLKYSLELVQLSNRDSQVKFLIVSNKYHLLRAKLLARRLGIDAYGLPAKTPPNNIVKSYIREYFAFIKSTLLDW